MAARHIDKESAPNELQSRIGRTKLSDFYEPDGFLPVDAEAPLEVPRSAETLIMPSGTLGTQNVSELDIEAIEAELEVALASFNEAIPAANSTDFTETNPEPTDSRRP